VEPVAGEHGMMRGRFGRWTRVDVARLTEDEDLVEQVRRGQLLGPDRAAARSY
jgi:hypothetical protein